MQWNALKLLNEKGEFISGEDGAEVLEIAENEDFVFAEVKKLGKYLQNETYLHRHIDMILAMDLVDVESIKKKQYKVVVDGVNSTGGDLRSRIIESIRC